jgi:hypothetical protein
MIRNSPNRSGRCAGCNRTCAPTRRRATAGATNSITAASVHSPTSHGGGRNAPTSRNGPATNTAMVYGLTNRRRLRSARASSTIREPR